MTAGRIAPTFADVGRWVAEHVGQDLAVLMGHDRAIVQSLPRALMVWGARAGLALSLPQIGARLGGRHHTSILWHWRRATLLASSDPDFRRSLDAMAAHFGWELPR